MPHYEQASLFEEIEVEEVYSEEEEYIDSAPIIERDHNCDWCGRSMTIVEFENPKSLRSIDEGICHVCLREHYE